MNILLHLIFFIAVFGQLGRVSFFNQTINIYPHELLMIIFVGWSLMKYNSKANLRTSSFVRALVIFVSVFLLSLVWRSWEYSLFENGVGFLYWARLSVYLCFGVSLGIFYKKHGKKAIEKSLTTFTIATIILSVCQFVFYPRLTLMSLGWDPHEFRVFGTFFDSTIASVIFVLLFVWRLNETITLKKFSRGNIFFLVSLYILILLSYSRLGYGVLVVGMAVLLYRRIRIRTGVALLLFFFLSISFLPQDRSYSTKLDRTETVSSRLVAMREGIDLFRRYPVLGVGYNRIAFEKKSSQALHSQSAFPSSFVTIMASSGVLGFSALIFLLWQLYKEVDRFGKSILAIILSGSVFENILLQNFVLLLLVVFVVITLFHTPRSESRN